MNRKVSKTIAFVLSGVLILGAVGVMDCSSHNCIVEADENSKDNMADESSGEAAGLEEEIAIEAIGLNTVYTTGEAISIKTRVNNNSTNNLYVNSYISAMGNASSIKAEVISLDGKRLYDTNYGIHINNGSNSGVIKKGAFAEREFTYDTSKAREGIYCLIVSFDYYVNEKPYNCTKSFIFAIGNEYDNVEDWNCIVGETSSEKNYYMWTTDNNTVLRSICLENKISDYCIEIPEGITTIAGSAFNKSALKKVLIPSTVTEIEPDAVSENKVEFFEVDEKNETYYSNNGAVYSKETASLIAEPKGISPDEISNQEEFKVTYYGCLEEYTGNSETIKIPEGIVSISGEVFKNCSFAKEIILPDSIKVIFVSAFEGCTGLTSIVIPDSVIEIYNDAFKDCTNLKEIKLSENLDYIAPGVFANCKSLEKIEIPENVTSICDDRTDCICDYGNTGVFAGCDNLQSIKVSEYNQLFDSRDDCNAIIKTNENAIVAACKKTIIPDNVEKIGYRAFSGCSNLKSVEIGSNVNEIDSTAFNECASLESIKVSSENETYDSRNNCNAIILSKDNLLVAGCKNTVIPLDVTGIGSYAFRGCSSLGRIAIPSGVTKIEYNAFDHCGNLEIAGDEGSAAEKFALGGANDSVITFIKNEKPAELVKTLSGDADCNNKVDLRDAKIVLKLALGIPVDVSELGVVNSDYDGDGKIDIRDARKTLWKSLC